MTRRTAAKQSRRSRRPYYSLIVACYCTIGLFLLGSIIPETRVWGINWWAYQPIILQAVLILIAVGAGPLLLLWSKHIKKADNSSPPAEASGKYWIFVTVTVLGFTGLYLAFPSTTHFLGDGYYLLTRLAHEVGSLKSWDIGASLINDATINALGERSEENVLLAFRIIAVGSGFLMLIMVASVSRRLFESFMDRSLFFLGIASSGYTLHFFGYVENYALFVVAICAFTLLGLTAALGKTPRWLAIIPVLVACGLHIFGLTLLPALLYILLYDKRPFAQAAQMSRTSKAVVMISIGIMALGIYFFLFYNYYFFRFAFLPLIPDRFTVDDDFLLSPKHLADFLNLLVMLVPGIGIFLTEVLSRRKKRLWNGPDRRFLLLLVTSTIACIYLFNPGHGMPRNWDLFSLPGIPLSILVFYILLSNRQPSYRRFLSASLAVILGFLVLVPRVSSQWIPEVAIKHFKNYVELDRTRNRNARSLLIDYYRNKGDEAAADRWHRRAVESFPEATLTNQGKQMLKSGNFDRAESLFRRALQINPIFVDAYSNLATCYINRGHLEEALELLEIADGLNPLNASAVNNKGTVYLRMGDLQRAEKQYLEVLRIDRNHVNAMAGLVSVNIRKKDDQRTSEYLKMLSESPDLPAEFFKQGVDACLEAGLTQSARLAFSMAAERGASRAWQRELMARFPILNE